ncbi:transposase [Bacteroides sp.]
MKKRCSYCYSLSHKQEVICYYESGLSISEICLRTGISESYIGLLIRKYRRFGPSGLLIRPGHYYSQEEKLSILEQMSSKSLSLLEASLEYDVSSSILCKWRQQYRTLGVTSFLRLKSLHLKSNSSEDMENKKISKGKSSLATSSPSNRERELEHELKRARAEIAFLKKLRVLAQEEEKRERMRTEWSKSSKS